MLDTHVIDDVAGFEVVGAVHHQVGTNQQLLGVLSVQIGDEAGEFDLAVDAAQFALGDDGFGQVLA